MDSWSDGIGVTEKPRKYSLNSALNPENYEEITFPPSTELIQDEYKHENNEMGLVYIFYSTADTEGKGLLMEALTDQQYKISDENIIKMRTRQQVINKLQEIAETDHSNKTCLLLFILGLSIGDDLILPEDNEIVDYQLPSTEINWKNCITVKDVWINFTGDNCRSMINKPKVFVFQGSEKYQPTRFDSSPSDAIKTQYSFPAEADMLVIYNKAASIHRNSFIEPFCNNLNDYGKEDDIIGIVTRTANDKNTRPLIISTLTRKFFISPSSHRGHHYEYNINNDRLLEMIISLTEEVDNVKSFVTVSRRTSTQKQNSPSSSVHTVDGKLREKPSHRLPQSRKPTTSVSSNKSASSSKAQREPWRF